MFEFLPHLKNKPVLIKLAILILIITVSLVLMMVIGVLVAIPFFGIGVLKNVNIINDFSDPSFIGLMKYFQVVNQLGVFLLPTLAFAYLESRNIGQYLKIDKRPSLFPLVIAILLIVAVIPAINWMVGINEQMHFPGFMKKIEDWMRASEDKTNLMTEAFLKVDTIWGLLVNMLIIALLAAIGEEILFRGVVLRIFLEGMKNIHLAVLLSSILFSALHMQFFGFLPRTALGVLFGYIFIWTGSLWIPVILHFVFNGASVVVAYLYQKNLISTDFETFGVSRNIFVISASFIFTVLFLWIIYRNGQKPFFHRQMTLK